MTIRTHGFGAWLVGFGLALAVGCADVGTDDAVSDSGVIATDTGSDAGAEDTGSVPDTTIADTAEPADVGGPDVSPVPDSDDTADTPEADLLEPEDVGGDADEPEDVPAPDTAEDIFDAPDTADVEEDTVEPGPCDDDNICTDDYLDEVSGECVNQYVYGVCCSADPMCDDGDPCTRDKCVDELCTHEPSCCETDTDCGETSECAQPVCLPVDEATGIKKCTLLSLETEGCCNTLMYFAGFDDGTLGGVLVQNAFTEVGWQLTENTQANSPPGALWYGSALTGDFDNGTFNSGVATFPSVTLPAGVDSRLEMDLYLDVEPGFSYDRLEVRLVDVETGEIIVLWDKSQAFLYGGWFTLSLELQAFGGRTMAVSLFFDTFDADDNDGQGVFVDNVRISSSCTETVCASDFDCDDGHAFTIDECAIPEGQTSGSCVHSKNSAYCVTFLECDDGEPCTINACIGQECYYAPNATCCLSDAECDDGNPCTANDCVGVSSTSGGSCNFLALPGCCQNNVQCDDGDPCTQDLCEQNSNTCAYLPIEGCCSVHEDCDDGEPCTENLCVAGACQFNNVCCGDDDDCDDGESLCTQDVCIDGVCQANFTDNIQCCTVTQLFTQFTAGSWGPFISTDDENPTDGVSWFAVPSGGISAGGALKYGPLGVGTYDTGAPHAATVTTYAVTLPVTQVHEMSFWVKLDNEYANGDGSLLWDRLRLEAIRTDNDESTLLWDSAWGDPQWWSELDGVPTGSVWTFVDAIDLSSLKGRTIQLRFSFDTIDADANGYDGVLIDDVLLFSTCGP